MAGADPSTRLVGLTTSGLASYGTFLAFTLTTFWLIQQEVPDPYMDEIFHIPQAQNYCKRLFNTWDPALTTPPGLYILSLIPSTLLHLPCTPTFLRSTNLLILLLLPFLVASLLSTFSHSVTPASTKAKPNPSWRSHFHEAVVISFFPPLWFLGHLYYTDLGSLALVLAAWSCARRHRHVAASLLGLLSLTFRQTNVIWLAFIVGSSIVSHLALIQTYRTHLITSKLKTFSPLKPVRLAADYNSFADFLTSTVQLPFLLLQPPRSTLQSTLPILAPYIPSFLAFLVFILWNGGIVLGHQEYHTASLHFPQLPYFFAFSTALGWPVLLLVEEEGKGRKRPGGIGRGLKWRAERVLRRGLSDALGGVRQQLTTLTLVLVTTLSVRYFTIAHPFLLSDNRHLPFYIYRRLINPFPLARYLLVPGYVACAIFWGGRLLRTQPPLTLLIFLLATLLTLTPSPLIEPRYFLIPFFILRILASPLPPPTPSPPTTLSPHLSPMSSTSTPTHSPHTSPEKKGTAGGGGKSGEGPSSYATTLRWLEFAWYGGVNVLAVWVFLHWKFRWESEEGIWQRFMW